MGKVRLLLKKRGHRWTGSGDLGSIGEGLVFGLFLLFGMSGLLPLLATQFFPWTGLPRLSLQSGLGIATLVVLSALALVGLGGLSVTAFRHGTSRERRRDLARQATQFPSNAPRNSRIREFPAIPRLEHYANSPGVCLEYRLPRKSKPGWSLFAVAAFCFMWLSLLVTFCSTLVSQITRGLPYWYLVPVVTFLAYVVVRSLAWFVTTWRDTMRLGPTHVEVAELPLIPGRTYQAALIQMGRMAFRKLSVRLACDEVATFRQGTDTRVERKRIVDREILELSNVVVNSKEPLQERMTLSCDSDAMHSFQSPSNAVEWKVVVRGEARYGAGFESEFGLVVYPADVDEHPSAEARWNR